MNFCYNELYIMNTEHVDEQIDRILQDYDASAETVELLRNVPILLLVGISGAGKDTIKKQLLATGEYHRIVTHTTRAPRENQGVMERSGVEYHFVDKPTMLVMLEKHELIEANRYASNIYGASVSEFQLARDEGKIAVADIDVNGVANFKRLAPDSTRPVFLLPPSYDVWRERWMQRYGGKSFQPEDFRRRLETAAAEIEHVLETPGYFIVINDDLARAVDQVSQIAHQARQDDVAFKEGREIMLQMWDAMNQALAKIV